MQVAGRVIVDNLQARKIGAYPESFTMYLERTIMPLSLHRADFYTEFKALYQGERQKEPSSEDAEKRKKLFSLQDEFLMLMRTDVSVYSLERNIWCKSA